jgi:hypothetical protein
VSFSCSRCWPLERIDFRGRLIDQTLQRKSRLFGGLAVMETIDDENIGRRRHFGKQATCRKGGLDA